MMVSVATDEFFERYRRRTYVTPQSYLAFITLYRSVYTKKVARVEDLATSINSGLAKLERGASRIESMEGGGGGGGREEARAGGVDLGSRDN